MTVIELKEMGNRQQVYRDREEDGRVLGEMRLRDHRLHSIGNRGNAGGGVARTHSPDGLSIMRQGGPMTLLQWANVGQDLPHSGSLHTGSTLRPSISFPSGRIARIFFPLHGGRFPHSGPYFPAVGIRGGIFQPVFSGRHCGFLGERCPSPSPSWSGQHIGVWSR